MTDDEMKAEWNMPLGPPKRLEDNWPVEQQGPECPADVLNEHEATSHRTSGTREPLAFAVICNHPNS